MKPLFCPNCRRKIDIPKYILKMNIQGNIKLQCGHCNKATITYTPPKKEATL